MTENVIRDILAGEVDLVTNQLTTDTDLRTLGVDSVKLLSVVLKIERAFGVELEDKVVFSVRTISELAEAVDLAKFGQGGTRE